MYAKLEAVGFVWKFLLSSNGNLSNKLSYEEPDLFPLYAFGVLT